MRKRDIALLIGSGLIIVFSVFGFIKVSTMPDYGFTTILPGYLHEPVQDTLATEKIIEFTQGKYDFKLKPLAKYSVSAYLVSKRHYRGGFMNWLSPWDYALAWGTIPEQLEHIEFDQIVRFCLYKFKSGAPVDEEYLSRHMANTHLIPSNNNIRKALRFARKGDVVKLDGYLVNVEARQDGVMKSTWHSSTSREDKGNGACEILYVENLQIGDRIYR